MATKKSIVKAGSKPDPKKAVKPAKATAPAKKATPATAKAAPKQASPAAKKPASPVKKAAPAPAKPVAKAPAKPAPKAAKVVAKSTKPVQKPAAKPVSKPAPKAAAKPVAKTPVKPAAAKKAELPKKITKPEPAPAPKAEKPAKAPKVPKVKVPVKRVIRTPIKPALAIKPKEEQKAERMVAPAQKVLVQRPVAPKNKGPKANAANPKDIKITPAKPVTLPKLSTSNASQYTPDFMKSVLDTAKQEPPQPLVRYSDNDLSEFKEIIQRKLESAKKELSYLQGLITRKDDQGGDDSDNRYMTMEDGSLSMEREQISQMASRQITFVDNLQKALMRIENKTYGICRETGKLIDKARLKAVPHATLSIEAKNAMNKNKNIMG